MRLFPALRTLVVFLFRRSRVEREMDEELHTHLEGRTDDLERQGVPRSQAERQARVEFGGYEQYKEECRDALGTRLLGGLKGDVRYGLRILAKNRGFTAVAISTLALGIGANTAIFSVVNAVLLRPLPYWRSNQLVRVWATNLKNGFSQDVASYPDFTDWAAQSHSFQQLAAYNGRAYDLTGGDHPEHLNGVRVSTGLLRLLGIRPALGRDFLAEEQQPGRDHVVLLSDGVWRSHFGADPKVLSNTVRLNDENYTVIGVLPAYPEFPPDRKPGLLVPLAPDTSRGHGFLFVIGRLRAGFTIDRAQAEMTTIARRLQQQYPKNDKDVGIELQPLGTSYVGELRPALLILMGAVGFVLLIACANVANLFLGRTSARRRELAVRASLGAGRERLIRQLLTEALVIGVMGGSLGLLLAASGLAGLVKLLSHSFSIHGAEGISVDRWVLAFTLTASLVTGLISGLAPAVGSSKIDLNESLKEGSRGLTATRGHTQFRSGLVVAEVALALVLLTGAGLALKSFVLLTTESSGLHTENVLTADFSLESSKYSHTATRAVLFRQILHRVQTLPGVQSAAVVTDIPLTHNVDTLDFSIEGLPDAPEQRRYARFNVVGPGYLRTLGIPLIAGRDFTELDALGAPLVVLINQAMARRFWSKAIPIGQRISTDAPGSPEPLGEHDRPHGAERAKRPTWFSVIGIAGNVRQMGLQSEAEPEVYVSYLQDPYRWPWMSLLLRTASDPLKLFPAIEQAVWSVDKDQPVSNPMTMDQIRSDSIAQPRVTALLLGMFATLALLLASIGLYGVVARSVNDRRHEIGVRIALGARSFDVFRSVVQKGMILAVAGTAIGLAGALAITRIMASVLHNVRPADLITFTAVSVLLITVTFLATYIPARRATRIDPMQALRYE